MNHLDYMLYYLSILIAIRFKKAGYYWDRSNAQYYLRKYLWHKARWAKIRRK